MTRIRCQTCGLEVDEFPGWPKTKATCTLGKIASQVVPHEWVVVERNMAAKTDKPDDGKRAETSP